MPLWNNGLSSFFLSADCLHFTASLSFLRKQTNPKTHTAPLPSLRGLSSCCCGCHHFSCSIKQHKNTPLPAEMTKVPCRTWQQCSVHLNSAVMKDRFVLFPLRRRWVFLIFLSRKHWLVCIICAWETERLTGSPQRLRQPRIRLSKPTGWRSPRTRVGGSCEKMKKTVKNSAAHFEVCAVLSGLDPITLKVGEVGCCRRRLKRKTSQVDVWSFHCWMGQQYDWGSLTLPLSLLNILYFAPGCPNINL